MLLRSPLSPWKPARQAPHVLAVAEQADRWSLSQSGAEEQFARFSTDVAVARNCLILSGLISPLLSCGSMAATAEVEPACCVTFTAAFAVAYVPRLSKTCAVHVTSRPNLPFPAANMEDADVEFDRLCSTSVVPSDPINPNSYDSGISGSFQFKASNVNLVDISKPRDGSTVNLPLKGGLFVVTWIDAEVDPHFKENV